ncbi:MAG TPA: hypothetical protein VN777_05325 [Terriglobales bacterium]|nr:hypothetical protein [Terriglobales bacterium]
MNHKKHNPGVDGSQSYPPLLILGELIGAGQGTGIIENKSGRLEADIVLEQVSSILVFVPFKAHGRRPGTQ